MGYLLTGGFLKGYRTYILGGVVVVTAIAAFAVGDADLTTTIMAVAGGLGLNGLRSATGG